MPATKTKKTEDTVRKTKAKSLEEVRREEERKIVQEAAYIVGQIGEILRRVREGNLDGVKELLAELEERSEKLLKDYGDEFTTLPIRTRAYEVIGVEDPEEAKRLLEQVKERLKENDIPGARDIINALRNEIVVETTVMPLGVLRDALKLARNFLERANIARFVDTLNLLVDSVEIVETVFPKPLLEAFYLMDEISKVQEKDGDKETILELIGVVKEKIELARSLGYVKDTKDIESLMARIEKIEAGVREEKEQKEEIKELREEIKKTKEKAGERRKVKAKA